MLTAKQERFCQNIEVKRMSQRAAYLDAYPNAKRMKLKSVDEAACRLCAESKISSRLQEIRAEENAKIASEAAWTRKEAFRELQWMITTAKKEIESKGEMSGPTVSALTNAIKELDTIYAVAEKTEGCGVLEDILHAVKGISDD